VRSKRDRRRMILADESVESRASAQVKLVRFGAPHRVADHCTLWDVPAEFAHCLDCRYNRGAQGSGILCAHRFGLDPTIVSGMPTQLRDGEIVPLDPGD
jgi:hypothetical protein